MFKEVGKTVLVIEKNSFGGQIALSPKVENIPGTQLISGAEFADKLTEQALALVKRLGGEYLAWYSRGLTLVRCHITGEQPLCYCEDLTLVDCTFGADANLMLEYSTVRASIKGDVTSIKNPTSGSITVAGHIGEIIIDQNRKAPADCTIHELHAE